MKDLESQKSIACGDVSIGFLDEYYSSTYSDILVSLQLPAGLSLFSSKPVLALSESAELTRKLAECKCRYLLIPNSTDEFYEREPYESIFEGKVIYTRVLSIPAHSASSRWYYAFQIEKNSISAPKTFTRDPMEEFVLKEKKRKLTETVDSYVKESSDEVAEKMDDLGKVDDLKEAFTFDSPPENYLCRICNIPGHYVKQCPNKKVYICKICNESGHHIRDCPKKNAKREKMDISNCWFCLANKNAETHLVVNIGEQIYLALSKGGLVKFHLLILPISHIAQGQEMAADVQAEVDGCKEILRESMIKIGKGFISFFIKIPLQHHVSIPIVPFDVEDLDSVLHHILEYGMKQGIVFDSFDAESDKREFYCILETSNGKKLIHYFDRHFDLTFFRAALSDYFGKPEFMDWRKCTKSIDEECAEVAELRELLK